MQVMLSRSLIDCVVKDSVCHSIVSLASRLPLCMQTYFSIRFAHLMMWGADPAAGDLLLRPHQHEQRDTAFSQLARTANHVTGLFTHG